MQRSAEVDGAAVVNRVHQKDKRVPHIPSRFFPDQSQFAGKPATWQ
jgi:hypothetical protein